MAATSGTHRVFVDPARVNLRKAVRATVVVPALFAAFVLTGGSSSALYVAFGSFAALVFADFGGALPRRLRAYLALAVAGGILVAVGTAFADTVWPAVLATLVVAFVIALSGALGGYFAAGVTAATLAFVLAVMTPGVEADLWARELGWLVGVGVAGMSAVLLWPVHQRDRVRAAAVAVMHEVATALASPALARDLGRARAADATLSERAGVVYRPAGSIARERALVELVIAVRRLVPLLDAVTTADRSADADTLPEYDALVTRAGATLEACAQVLAGEPGAGVDLDALEAARATHTRALEAWTAATLERDAAAPVVDRFTAAFPLRRLSMATAVIAQHASLAAHDPAARPREWSASLAQARLVVRAHCDLRSVRFRNAARAGLGLAIAVLVAKEASLEHSFWVVLGALAVLRSSALGTGATALQALAGSLLGFGVASALMATIGGDDTLLWIALPIVVFLAGYTPGAVNFVVGQASFTVFVVVLFNVLVPEGWRTGLVRVQDVAIGAAISVVVGALLWPRGARGVARREFADLLRAGTRHLRLAIRATVDGGSFADARAAAAAADDARARATAALEDLALEHGGGQVDRQAWAGLLLDDLVLRLAGDGITRWAEEHGRVAGCDAARASLDAEGTALVDAVDTEADTIERSGVSSTGTGGSVTLEVPPSLGECLVAHAHDGLTEAVGLVWVHEWLVFVGDRPR